jgi:putative heme-binding domain-containing protein
LLAHVEHHPESTENLLRYVHHIARYGREAALDDLLAFAREHQPQNLRHQAALFKALQQGMQERGLKLSKAGKDWAQQVTERLLASTANEELLAGAEMAGTLQLKSAGSELQRLSLDKKLPEPQRRAAIDALRAIDARARIGLFGDLLEDAAEPMPIREHVALVLAGINSPEANAELVKSLSVAPARLQNTIANGLATSLRGAEKLLDAVAAGKASARLLQEGAVPRRLEQHARLKERMAVLTKGLPSVDQRMQALIHRRREGFGKASIDVAAGMRVFERSCAICHQVGGKGAKVGPNLDGVGNRGLDRLLEDIIDPNRNVDQAFRATTLALKNGQIVSGLVLREEGEVVILADAQGKEVRITKSSIDERTVSQLSPMPANLVEQIPEPDFYNLLGYLLSLRPAKETKLGQ